MSRPVDPPNPGNAENVTAPAGPEIPEKLRGKSPEELASMYQNLEKQMGAQSSELGQLRQMLTDSTAASAPKEEPADFYDDPDAALNQRLAPVLEELRQLKVDNTARRLESAHPDYEQVSSSSEFEKWVAESPVRINQYMSARNGDFDSANELLTLFKQVNSATEQAEESTKEAITRDRKLRAAASEKGSAGISPGKQLRAADLQELRRTNPERYRAMLPDIMRAYQEGRVVRN